MIWWAAWVAVGIVIGVGSTILYLRFREWMDDKKQEVRDLKEELNKERRRRWELEAQKNFDDKITQITEGKELTELTPQQQAEINALKDALSKSYLW